jgi:hypothetical protein
MTLPDSAGRTLIMLLLPTAKPPNSPHTNVSLQAQHNSTRDVGKLQVDPATAARLYGRTHVFKQHVPPAFERSQHRQYRSSACTVLQLPRLAVTLALLSMIADICGRQLVNAASVYPGAAPVLSSPVFLSPLRSPTTSHFPVKLPMHVVKRRCSSQR